LLEFGEFGGQGVGVEIYPRHIGIF
jgi:hypothetical protein